VNERKKDGTMIRKRFLATAGAAAAAALPGVPAGAADEAVFCGVYSSTGAYAAFGRDTDRGFQLAVNEVKKSVAGHAIKYITRDDQTKPDVGQQQATDAYEHDGARFFAGCASSAVALAIAQVVKDKHALFWTSVGADEITGKDCNPYTFRWSVPAYGAVRATMYPFIQKFPNAKKWYTITPSYVFGESLLTNVKEVAQEKGITLIGNDYHPLGATEFSNFIAKAAEAKPDVLCLLNFGGDAIKALKTATSYGLKKNTKILYVWSGGLLDFAASARTIWTACTWAASTGTSRPPRRARRAKRTRPRTASRWAMSARARTSRRSSRSTASRKRSRSSPRASRRSSKATGTADRRARRRFVRSTTRSSSRTTCSPANRRAR
jgi:ABC-type branched-subunit amino acid transport system substrate-binding protein